jgi:hypothetical protein
MSNIHISYEHFFQVKHRIQENIFFLCGNFNNEYIDFSLLVTDRIEESKVHLNNIHFTAIAKIIFIFDTTYRGKKRNFSQVGKYSTVVSWPRAAPRNSVGHMYILFSSDTSTLTSKMAAVYFVAEKARGEDCAI